MKKLYSKYEKMQTTDYYIKSGLWTGTSYFLTGNIIDKVTVDNQDIKISPRLEIIIIKSYDDSVLINKRTAIEVSKYENDAIKLGAKYYRIMKYQNTDENIRHDLTRRNFIDRNACKEIHGDDIQYYITLKNSLSHIKRENVFIAK